ncbi:MAG: DUF885 domain-containing protein [Cyclobacteriaceae bacterium]
MKNLLFLLPALLLFSCQPKVQETSELPPISEVFENYHQERLTMFPLEATYAGDERYNDILPNNLTVDFEGKLEAMFTKYKDQLAMFDKSALTEEEQMSYDVLMWECDMGLSEFAFDTELMPVDQFWSMHLQIGQFASGSSVQPFKTAEDYDNWLNRVNAFMAWCDTAMVNMKKGMETGVVLPKSLIKKVIPQFADFAKEPVEDNLFYTPAKNFPDAVGPDNKSRLEKSYRKMVVEQVIPKFKAFNDFMINEYLPAGRETSGIYGIPNGEAYYNNRIKYYTTTTMTADEIFELGKSEVARLSAEMEKVKAQVGFEGDLSSFFDHVRNKKELMPFTDPQQVIDNFNAIHDKMKPQLSQLFDLTPKTAFVVKQTEAFREASASAEYNPGSLDGTRPGVFYVPIPDVSSYNFYSDEDLFLHEAIPGHHYQISLQQENENLPSFRKPIWYSAYGEGWALYSESLGKELGLYDDPYQYFGMLGAEMHRAIRLVVDAGMHSKGWTREQAIQYSLDNEAEPEASITSEIERYMAGPAQALSYKIGQLKIRQLRAKAEEALGDKFDIKVFHNKVLESGCIPLQLLENKIDKWIAEAKV